MTPPRQRQIMVWVAVANAISGLCLAIMGVILTDEPWGWLLTGLGCFMLVIAAVSFRRFKRGNALSS